MAVNSFMVPLGTPTPPFALPSLDGQIVTSEGLAPGRPLLVMFLSNHCPYVRHIERELGSLVAEYAADVAAVAICSNDIKNYPDDGPVGLTEQVHRAGFTFPYLIDDTTQRRPSDRQGVAGGAGPGVGRSAGTRTTGTQHGLRHQVEARQRAVLTAISMAPRRRRCGSRLPLPPTASKYGDTPCHGS
jgi:thiol-disulfide isomerase/thioredoxin